MAIRYVCDHCGDLEPALWDEEDDLWMKPEHWFTLDYPGESICAHLCGVECLIGFVTQHPVVL